MSHTGEYGQIKELQAFLYTQLVNAIIDVT